MCCYQGCKSIVSSLSAVAIALLSFLNIADTATDTIASVLSIAIVFVLLKTQISSFFVIFHFMNTTQSAFLKNLLVVGTLNTGLKDFLGFQQDQGTSKMLDRCKLLTFLTVFDDEMLCFLLILLLSLRLAAIPSASGRDIQI
jgi:hypothetical protein